MTSMSLSQITWLILVWEGNILVPFLLHTLIEIYLLQKVKGQLPQLCWGVSCCQQRSNRLWESSEVIISIDNLGLLSVWRACTFPRIPIFIYWQVKHNGIMPYFTGGKLIREDDWLGHKTWRLCQSKKKISPMYSKGRDLQDLPCRGVRGCGRKPSCSQICYTSSLSSEDLRSWLCLPTFLAQKLQWNAV